MCRLKVSVILPVYNEEEILGDSVGRIREFLDHMGVDYELIICDDNSSDGTSSAARQLCLNNNNIVLLRFDQRIGKGGTIKNASKVAEGEVIVFMDSDLSTNLRHLSQLIHETSKTGGIGIGVRDPALATRGNFNRKFLSIAYNLMVRILFRTGVTDHQCGFKGFTSTAAKLLFRRIRANGFEFDTELIANARWLRIPITVIPVEWRDSRVQYPSKVIPIRAALTMLTDLIILRLSRIAGKTIIGYREVGIGSFTDEVRNKTHKTTHIWIDVGSRRVLSALRKIYLIVAFGRR